MSKRERLTTKKTSKSKKKDCDKSLVGSYFIEPDTATFSSGCTPLDLALGGGFAVDRIINVVGDKSTGKTLLAIEACVNFNQVYPKAQIYYGETESAFDKAYAANLGMPVDKINFPEGLYTIEDWFDSLDNLMRELKGRRSLYILDSLDALSDDAEMARGIRDGTYGMGKPKQMSQLFRRLTQQCAKNNMTVMIISQVRENIGVSFGKKTTRSGGRALDFYASQVMFLAHMGQLKKQRKSVERVTGVRIKALVEKNKVGMPFRSCVFPIHFGYGIEDAVAIITWMLDNKMHRSAFSSEQQAKDTLKTLDKMTADEYSDVMSELKPACAKAYREVEERFLPTRSKY